MIKALFFDIDGTLVSFHTHRIPRSTVESLEKAKKKGLKIFISTGRPLTYINNLDDIKSLIDGYITTNGAYILVGDKVIACHTIPKEDVCAMMKFSDERKFPCILVGESAVLVYNTTREIEEFFHQIVVRFRNGFDKQLTKHIYFFLQRRGNVYNLNFVVDYSLSFHLNDVNVTRNFFVLNDGNGYGANALTVSLFERVEHAVEVAVFFIYARDKEKLGHIQAFCKVYCLGRSEVYTAFCGNDNKRRLCHSDSLKNFALKIEITRSVK